MSVPARSLFALLVYSSLNCFAETAPERDSAFATAGQSGSAHFSVLPRVDKLEYFPCEDCHEFMDPNSEIRVLDVDPGHPETLAHGAGKIWCLSCHGTAPYNQLHTLLAQPVEFDESYLICGGCHEHKLRDWRHGAHGKRVANWQGDRLLYGCVECHDPHQPQLAPRAPLAVPPVRVGLERISGEAERQQPLWDRFRGERDDE